MEPLYVSNLARWIKQARYWAGEGNEFQVGMNLGRAETTAVHFLPEKYTYRNQRLRNRIMCRLRAAQDGSLHPRPVLKGKHS